MKTVDSSRRRFLAAGSAAAVFASLHEAVAAEATQDHDAEIIALCQAAIAADKQCDFLSNRCDNVAARNEGRGVTLEDRNGLLAANKAYYDALDKALSCKPHTTRGVRAMVELIQRDYCMDIDRTERFFETLLDSPVLSI